MGVSTPSAELRVRKADTGGMDLDAATKLMMKYLEWAPSMMTKEHGVFEGSFDSESVRKGTIRYLPPSGRLILAELRGVPIGVVALRTLNDGIVEIKGMYVQPAARGLHAGSNILDGLINEAKGMNASAIRLDSAGS